MKQPGHLTSMKKDRGAGTRFWWQNQFRSSIIYPSRNSKNLKNISYLKLVLAGLSGRSWVEEIDGENLNRQNHVSSCTSISIKQSILGLNHLRIIPKTLLNNIHRNPSAFQPENCRSCANLPSPQPCRNGDWKRGFPYHLDCL